MPLYYCVRWNLSYSFDYILDGITNKLIAYVDHCSEHSRSTGGKIGGFWLSRGGPLWIEGCGEQHRLFP